MIEEVMTLSFVDCHQFRWPSSKSTGFLLWTNHCRTFPSLRLHVSPDKEAHREAPEAAQPCTDWARATSTDPRCSSNGNDDNKMTLKFGRLGYALDFPIKCPLRRSLGVKRRVKELDALRLILCSRGSVQFFNRTHQARQPQQQLLSLYPLPWATTQAPRWWGGEEAGPVAAASLSGGHCKCLLETGSSVDRDIDHLAYRREQR